MECMQKQRMKYLVLWKQIMVSFFLGIMPPADEAVVFLQGDAPGLVALGHAVSTNGWQ